MANLAEIKQIIKSLLELLIKLVAALTKVEEPVKPPVIIVSPPPTVIPEAPQGSFKIYDGGINNYNDVRRNSKFAFTFNNKSNVKLSRIHVKNSGGLYFKNCNGIDLRDIKVDHIYSIYFQDCRNINLTNIFAEHGRKLIQFRGDCHDVTIKNLVGGYGLDWWPGKPIKNNKNGDLLLTENECKGFVIEGVESYNNADAGLDLKSSDMSLKDIHCHHNRNGIKFWGDSVIASGYFNIHDNSDYNIIMPLAGDITIYNAHLKKAGKRHIKMGLSAYTPKRKSLDIKSGSYDNSAPLIQKNAKSTFENGMDKA